MNGDSAEAAGLCLRADPSRSEIAVGAPVHLVISLANCGDTPREVVDLLSPDFGFLGISIREGASGDVRRYRPALLSHGRGRRPQRLEPGERIVSLVPLTVDGNGWLFRTSGDFVVRVVYGLEGLEEQELAVAIRVVPPPNPDERSAAASLMTSSVARFLILNGPLDSPGAGQLERTCEDYPQTRSGRFAATALLLSRGERTLHSLEGPDQVAECSRVADEMVSQMELLEDPGLYARAAAQVIDCWRLTGDPERTELFWSDAETRFEAPVWQPLLAWIRNNTRVGSD